MRRRVRGLYPRTTTRPTSGRTSPGPRPGPGSSSSAAGPNRIGQGVEFDYCCVHASFALRELGYESVMVNSNPRDGLHRLRHLGPALFRTPDPGRRPSRLPRGEAPGRDRPVRRPDAPQPRPPPGPGGGPHHRDEPRGHRPGRGPGPVQGHPEPARAGPAAQRNSHLLRAGPEGGGGDRLSRHRETFLRPGREVHGDPLRRGLASGRRRAVHEGGGGGLLRAPDPDRQVPRGRHRDRCRRRGRRRELRHRGAHGAHRGGRHPLGGQRLRDPSLLPERRSHREAQAEHLRPGRRPERGGPHEHPVRHQERHHLRPRGQPPRLPDGSFHQQGHGRSLGQGGGQGDDGGEARNHGASRRGGVQTTSPSRSRSSPSTGSTGSTRSSAPK